MKRATAEQVNTAMEFTSLLTDVYIEAVLGDRGKDSVLDHKDHPHFDILQAYTLGEMTYVEVIWLLMNRLTEGEPTNNQSRRDNPA